MRLFASFPTYNLKLWQTPENCLISLITSVLMNCGLFVIFCEISLVNMKILFRRSLSSLRRERKLHRCVAFFTALLKHSLD